MITGRRRIYARENRSFLMVFPPRFYWEQGEEGRKEGWELDVSLRSGEVYHFAKSFERGFDKSKYVNVNF